MSSEVIVSAPPLRLGPFDHPSRGLIDSAGFLLAVVGSSFLWPLAEGIPPLRAFAITLCALFAISAAYHSIPWSSAWT